MQRVAALALLLFSRGMLDGQEWPYRAMNLDQLAAQWSRRTGLNRSDVLSMIRAAGMRDSTPDYLDAIDHRTLRKRGDVLVVTADGNGHCLTLHVLRKKADGYRVVWTVSELPEGAGLCRMGSASPRAYARAPDEIVVRIADFDYVQRRVLDDQLYVYKACADEYCFERQYSEKSGIKAPPTCPQ